MPENFIYIAFGIRDNVETAGRLRNEPGRMFQQTLTDIGKRLEN